MTSSEVAIGKWTKVSREEYDTHPGLRSTDLKLLLRSGMHFKTALVAREEREQTAAMRFGTIIHQCVLEPDIYLPKLIIEPKVNKRTNEGKKILEEFHQLTSPDSIVVTPDEAEIFATITDVVRSHPVCEKIFENGCAEVSGFAECLRGVKRKIQPDWRRNDGIIVDLKTTVDASPKGFMREVINYKYAFQAAYYLETANLIEPGKYHTWLWIAVEKEPPYAVGIYQLDANSLNSSYKLIEKAVGKYLDCEQTNTWNGYDTFIQNLVLPDYSLEI